MKIAKKSKNSEDGHPTDLGILKSVESDKAFINCLTDRAG